MKYGTYTLTTNNLLYMKQCIIKSTYLWCKKENNLWLEFIPLFQETYFLCHNIGIPDTKI